ncbi:hypothetical protein HIM_09375 [Hirsutella minnesotensis 3608]|uniref:Uncharacterized protein n=1 Tax=Hirsutella minnesotensis 3608 TaxID=1043627 RepID=A0A0F7ZXS5_9HYPO|nr:hypothetical protein HIM_09375 [Hirsutella minnesotensis 3608]
MSSQNMATLAESTVAAHQAAFAQAVAEARSLPPVFPYTLLGAYIVPILWLTIPHVGRPRIYRTRWLVMVFVVAFNAHLLLKSSSAHKALAYVVGFVLAWGTFWSATLLIWTRSQFEAARAVRRDSGRRTRISSPRGSAAASREESYMERRKKSQRKNKSDQPYRSPANVCIHISFYSVLICVAALYSCDDRYGGDNATQAA